jgi:Cu+-exporting ATPase
MSPAAERAEAIRFPIAGMTCSSCVNRISRHLRSVDGVSRVRVDLRTETATVVRDPSRAPDSALDEAVRAAGYEPELALATAATAEPSRPSLLARLARWVRRDRTPHADGATIGSENRS